MSNPTIRFRIDFDSVRSIGPGKIELLEHIRETGSLSQAGRDLEMSYRRAWLLLDNMNTSFREPVVVTNVGGKAGGGAVLTAFGESLIGAYRRLENDFNTTAAKSLSSFGALLSDAKRSSAAMRTPLVRSTAPRRVKAPLKKTHGRARKRP